LVQEMPGNTFGGADEEVKYGNYTKDAENAD
jgi:hypothetical protein